MQTTFHLKFGAIPLDITFDASIDPSKIIHKNLRHFIVPRGNASKRAPSLSVVFCARDAAARMEAEDVLFLKKYFGGIYEKRPHVRNKTISIAIAVAACRSYYANEPFRKMLGQARRSPGQWTIVGFTGCVLLIRKRSTEGTLFLDNDRSPGSHRADVLNAAACVASLAAPAYGSLFLHGTGLRVRNEGHLFLGRSGAGKSTVARLAGRHAVLSDDGIIVSRDRGSWRISPAPLIQTTGSLKNKHSAAYKLSGIYFLHQAPHTRLKRIAPAKALSEILKYYVHFFRYCDIIKSEMIFNLSRHLVSGLTCYMMSFEKNKRFLNLLPGRKQ